MGQWLVNRGDSQFSVGGLGDLKALAQRGDLDAGDLIQPEGAADWLYAVEIPELKGMVRSSLADDDDIEFRKGGGGAMKAVLYGIFGIMLVGGLGGMVYFFQQLPTGEERLLGEGGALAYSEVVSLKAQPLLSQPEAGASAVSNLAKDEKLDLLAKRGDYYRVKNKAGQEGWVLVDDTLAVYQMGDDKIRAKLDPLYNPDQYAKVSNASWLGTEDEPTAVFQVMLENTSDYDMENIVLSFVIKDSKGVELSRQEFEIEGELQANSSTMVGTLNPPEEEVEAAEKAGEDPPEGVFMATKTFGEQTAEMDEEMQEEMYNRWLDGIEIPVEDDFVEATVRIAELRAVPESRE